jgi:CRP-like cAMP-binding protein
MNGTTPDCGSRNLLLSLLKPEEYAALRPMLEVVRLEPQSVLHTPGEGSKYVYFPRSGFMSVAISLRDGTMVEVAPVGREGMAGVPAKGPAAAAMTNALIVVHGEDECAYRMRVEDFRREMDKCGAFADIVNHYGEAFLGVVMQSSGCNAAHAVEQRMAKWLLMAQDRLGSNQFSITQEFLATLLGATRQTVNGVISAWERRRVIDYTRSQIEILDRRALEIAACECYEVSAALLNRVSSSLDRLASR